MRESLELKIDGLRLVGTWHMPPGFVPSDSPDSKLADAIGVLLLNFGFAPRASHGDVAVLKADRLAQAGYHVFRFDLPGIGDSEGHLPDNAVTMVQFIQAAGHAEVTAEMAQGLKRQLGLGRLLLGGH